MSVPVASGSFCAYVQYAIYSVVQSCLFATPGTVAHQALLSPKPPFLASPALAGGFFTTRGTWENPFVPKLENYIFLILFLYGHLTMFICVPVILSGGAEVHHSSAL